MTLPSKLSIALGISLKKCDHKPCFRLTPRGAAYCCAYCQATGELGYKEESHLHSEFCNTQVEKYRAELGHDPVEAKRRGYIPR